MPFTEHYVYKVSAALDAREKITITVPQVDDHPHVAVCGHFDGIMYFASQRNLMRSEDDGWTWQPVLQIVPGDDGGEYHSFVTPLYARRGPVGRAPNGDHLVTTYTSFAGSPSRYYRSTDLGRTWRRVDNERPATAPALWFPTFVAPSYTHYGPGSLTPRTRRLWAIDGVTAYYSDDNGRTWGTITPSPGQVIGQAVAAVGNVGSQRRIRSIALHRGEVFYSSDDIGVLRARSDGYRLKGSITSAWFDGGFPELQKNFLDVFIRLQRPLREPHAGWVEGEPRESVRIEVQVDGKPPVLVGDVAVGRSWSLFPIPEEAQQGRQIRYIITLTSGFTSYKPGDRIGDSSPTVTAFVMRYRPIPIQGRVTGFTVKAAASMQFRDGSWETRTPAQIVSDLFALQNAGRVPFSSMVEPNTKYVIATNISLKPQLIGRRNRPEEPEESYVGVELLDTSLPDSNTVIPDPPEQDPEELPPDDPERGPGDDTPKPNPGGGDIREDREIRPIDQEL